MIIRYYKQNFICGSFIHDLLLLQLDTTAPILLFDFIYPNYDCRVDFASNAN